MAEWREPISLRPETCSFLKRWEEGRRREKNVSPRGGERTTFAFSKRFPITPGK